MRLLSLSANTSDLFYYQDELLSELNVYRQTQNSAIKLFKRNNL